MHIEILQLTEGAKKAKGTTVVIDVFRAFPTAWFVWVTKEKDQPRKTFSLLNILMQYYQENLPISHG